MAMTEEEKKEIKESVLTELKSESTDITELEEATSLDGLESLPAMSGTKLVVAPIKLLSQPAEDAAAKANEAASGATDAATVAKAAAQAAQSAASGAGSAASEATDAAAKATDAAAKVAAYEADINAAKDGATARFDGMVSDPGGGVSIYIGNGSSSTEVDKVLYHEDKKVFVGYAAGTSMSISASYVKNWKGAGMYMMDDLASVRKDKVYVCDKNLWVWSDDEGTLVKASADTKIRSIELNGTVVEPDGQGKVALTVEQPTVDAELSDSSENAVQNKAVKARIDGMESELTTKMSSADNTIASIANAAAAKAVGSVEVEEDEAENRNTMRVRDTTGKVLAETTFSAAGKIRSVSLNGADVAPDASGNVDIRMDEIAVDESLDADSTNPVQNKVVKAAIDEIADAAVGGVEVVEEDGKNTLTLLNKKGGVIATTEFSGGGGGGGTSTASRIVLTARLDKAQVKEGGTAQLTYTYDHVNADGAGDGIKADITVTVQRGTTQTYQATTKNVSAGTYTLDVSDYLLVGTTDVYVKAEATTEDGTKQTKQAYTSISVVTLKLTSSYNLGTAMAGGGYKDGDTIEVPFTITGSGTKDVSMYVDGGSTPMSQTISKSGTVNGSFQVKASSLSAGRHSVQLVAERDGLRSDSIYMDLLKAGRAEPYVGIKWTDSTGAIVSGTASPTLRARQYEQMSLGYVAYDPAGATAEVEVRLNGKKASTLRVPRSQQTYSNRFTDKGTQRLTLAVGATSYPLAIEVEESSLDIGEATYGLVAKLDAAGRSNSEGDPAEWTSGDVSTEFSGFDWSSNGWTGDALKLTNGARAVIGYQPFAKDIKSTGLTLELTMRVSNVTSRSAQVVKCIDGGKGLLITAEEASFKTGQSVTYTNEDDEQVTREIKLGTNFVADRWVKICLAISTNKANRLMELYVDGNRTGADIYDTSFNFAQDTPQDITIDSSEADVEIRGVRIYGRALTDDEELDNRMVDADTGEEMLALYDDNDILGDTGGVDIDKLRAKGKGVLRIVRANKLDDVYAENNKKTDFKADIYFYSPFGSDYDFVLLNCNIRIQGTSSTKYPSKNIRIYCAKGGEELSMTIGGALDPNGKNRYALRPGAIPMNLLCCKSDYSDSSMSLNTGGAKLFNDVMKEMGLLTPPQRWQYEQGGGQLSAVSVRTAIDGIPIDIFCSETVDGESEYYGQYNMNNEKSKSESLFGQAGLEGYEPTMPMTFEMLNNGAKMCLFQSDGDDDVAASFDEGLETNYPDDVKWAGLTTDQQAAVKRLYGWIRDCVPTGANSNDISTFKSSKFVSEIDQYFDKDFLLAYYLWTDYFLSVDQRAKNMMLRTWDGKVWYLTYYDGDTQLGKRNDCFLVYLYTTDRDTYDAEASKYAFEGRDSWLWNLVLANLQDDLKRMATKLRQAMTNERVLAMFNTEQAGNWSDRAYNKSGELKYIKPAVQAMYGKVWPFIYALQGSNTSHREYFIKNRFALCDAKYGTNNFTADNVDMYLSRLAADAADQIRITANEVYAFGYGTNNQPNLANSGIVQEGAVATLGITGAYTVNDPLRLYGASRMRVLDMTGAADHLKNGLDLGKCDVLRELDLQSSGNGSTGWWLVINACKSLRRLNLRNQAQAKTGSSTSKELDLTNQTKLEYLDARGTQVESVSFAEGAPLATAFLPGTLTTLRLAYLAKLTAEGLSVESYAKVETLIFMGCPGLDWLELLGKCSGVKRIRITGIDMDGDGALLDKCMAMGGVDEDGSYVDTCRLVGAYRLTRYADEESYAKWSAHYPELTITQPEYTMIKFDDAVADSANISNLDNATGYDNGNAYAPSGHVAAILARRHRVLAKHTGKGEATVCPLHDKDSNYFADAEDLLKATAAKLTGEMGDVMMMEPHYWYKGVNDYLNKAKYAAYSANEKCPSVAEHRKVELGELTVKSGYAIRVGTGYATVAEAEAAMASDSYCTVDVRGWRQVRWPSLPSSVYGAVMADADGRIVKRMKAVSDSGIIDGQYCFTSIPEGAATLAFTISNAAEFDYVLLTKGDKVADIEPDWVEHEVCLCGVYEGLVRDDVLRSVSGVQSTGSVSQADFKVYARNRGDGFQLVDWEMHKDVGNLFFAKYGERDSQGTCGPGTASYSRQTGASDATGMQDTKPTAKDGDTPPTITSDGYYSGGNAYVLRGGDDEKRTAIGSPVVMGYENWQGNKLEWTEAELNRGKVDYAWISPMGDGTERRIQGAKVSQTFYTRTVVHGRYMDTMASQTGGSYTSYYADTCSQGGTSSRVVARSGFNAFAYGGVSFAYTYFDSATVYAYFGSRLAFRGVVRVEESPAAFAALTETA